MIETSIIAMCEKILKSHSTEFKYISDNEYVVTIRDYIKIIKTIIVSIKDFFTKSSTPFPSISDLCKHVKDFVNNDNIGKYLGINGSVFEAISQSDLMDDEKLSFIVETVNVCADVAKNRCCC